MVEEEIEQDEDAIKVTTKATKLDKIEDAVFVIGHPRSGTSASCQLIDSSDEVEWLVNTQSNDANPYGYYEHKEFLSLSQQLMGADPGNWPVDDLGNMIETIIQFHGLFGAKLLHAPSWYYWNMMVNSETRALLVFRKPDLCRKSVWHQKLFGWGLDWHTQNNIMIDIMEENDKVVLTSFKRLLSKPEQVADKVGEKLDLDVDPSVIDPEQKSWDETGVVAGDLEWIVYDELKELESEQFGNEVKWDDR